MAWDTVGCSFALWFLPKRCSLSSLQCLHDHGIERPQSSTSLKLRGMQPQSRIQVHHPCLIPPGLFLYLGKNCSTARGCYTATHCTGPDDVTSSRKHIHSARPGNHMSITIHVAEQCSRVQIKGAFCLTSRSCLLGDESTSLMSRPAHSFLSSPHIRNSCNLESWLSGQVEATAQKEPN